MSAPPGRADDDVGAQVAPRSRRFLVVGHDATTDPSFSLNDLSGGTGRIDVLLRCVTNALCLSHGVRADTEVWLTLSGARGGDGPRTLRFDGSTIQHLNPDERSTAALVKRALGVDVVPNGHFEDAGPGVTVAEMGFEEAVVRFGAEGPVFLLERDGTDVRDLPKRWLAAGTASDGSAAGGPGFVLSDHHPFTDEELADLRRESEGRSVSVGPLWLQGHQVVTLVHDELDRRANP